MGCGNVSEIYICGLIFCLTPPATLPAGGLGERPRLGSEHVGPRGTSGGSVRGKVESHARTLHGQRGSETVA